MGVVQMCQMKAEESQCASAKAAMTRMFTSNCCGANGMCESAGGIPTHCSAQCADAFLPFWSRCGHAAYENEPDRLRSYSAFAETCATSDSVGAACSLPACIGSNIPSRAVGPDPD